MRLLGLLALFASVTLIGFAKSRSLKARALAIEQAARLTGELGIRMRFSAQQTAAVLHSLAQSGKYDRLPFLQQWAQAVEVGKAPEAALAGVLGQETLDVEAAQQLLRLAASLGRYDGVTLAGICEEFAQRLHEYATEAMDVYRDKGRLYRGLGVYGGAALVIILI